MSEPRTLRLTKMLCFIFLLLSQGAFAAEPFHSFTITAFAPTEPPLMVETPVCPEGEVWEFAVFAAFHNSSTPNEIRLELVEEANTTNAQNVAFLSTRMVGDGQPFSASQSLAVTDKLVYPGYRLRANFPHIAPGTQLTIEFVRRIKPE